jgi:hypothetical protein
MPNSGEVFFPFQARKTRGRSDKMRRVYVVVAITDEIPPNFIEAS